MVERVYWWQLAARGYGLADHDERRPAPPSVVACARVPRARARGEPRARSGAVAVAAGRSRLRARGRLDLAGGVVGGRPSGGVEAPGPAATSVRSRRRASCRCRRRTRSPSTGRRSTPRWELRCRTSAVRGAEASRGRTGARGGLTSSRSPALRIASSNRSASSRSRSFTATRSRSKISSARERSSSSPCIRASKDLPPAGPRFALRWWRI